MFHLHWRMALMMISAVAILRHILVLPMRLPIWKNPPTQNKQL